MKFTDQNTDTLEFSKKMVKIAFTGAHGTGKTTLIHNLIQKLKEKGVDADISEEVARRCPLEINEKAPTKTQLWILGKQLTEEAEKSQNCDVLVCDRCVIDTYSYENILNGEKPGWESFIKEYSKNYDLIIKVSSSGESIKADKQRSTNKEFQLQIDREINKNLQNFGLEYTEFKGEETLKEICEKIQN